MSQGPLEQIGEMLALGVSQLSLSEDQVDMIQSKLKYDSILAEELNRMSVEEREQVLHELHGIAEPIDESKPGFIDEKLAEMDREIQANLPLHKGGAYEEALSIDPSYCEDKALRLSFLRAARFNAQTAAKNLISFMHEKKMLFGTELLCKSIGFDDLDNDTQIFVKGGFLQILTGRDRAGRIIIVDIWNLRLYDSAIVYVSL